MIIYIYGEHTWTGPLKSHPPKKHRGSEASLTSFFRDPTAVDPALVLVLELGFRPECDMDTCDRSQPALPSPLENRLLEIIMMNMGVWKHARCAAEP